jgi:methylated-DNA-protein-cysteine methyltransferase-like protein
MTEFQRRVSAVIAGLAPGDVMAYGEVAEEAGFPGAGRAVGNFLRSPASSGLPWWRVIPADGRLPSRVDPRWADRLRADGVPVVDGRVSPHTSRAPRPPRSAG